MNRGAVEVDAILPLLYNLKDKYLIITIFKNKKTFESLKSINQLYDLWQSISEIYYIENIYNNFAYKVLKKIFFKISIFQILIDFLDNKIYGLENVFRKISTNDFELKYIFSDYQVYNHSIEILKKKNLNLKVVLFPNTPIISYSKIYLNKIYLRNCDYLLLTREQDIKRFINYDKFKFKVLVSGIMKFEKWWIDLLLKKRLKLKNLKNEKKFITIAYNSRFDWLSYEDKKKYELQLQKIVEIFKHQKNCLFIFKLHPNVNSKKFFSLIKSYNFTNYIISRDHLINLSTLSTLLISHKNSAAALDAMIVRCPVVELWSPGGHSYDSLNKMKILKTSKNIKEFRENFINALYKKNIKYFCNFKQFNKNYQSSSKKKFSSVKISNLLG